MSYTIDSSGNVVLRLSCSDYEKLLLCLSAVTAPVIACNLMGDLNTMLAFMNRLNEGNPNWTPYQVET